MSQFAAWHSALALQVLPLWLLIPDYKLRLRKGMPRRGWPWVETLSCPQ